MMTPIICTIVATRHNASSLPYAEVNQVKFSHACRTIPAKVPV